MVFDIEKYINELPDNTNKIDILFKKLKYIPDLSRFKNLLKLYCSSNQLTLLKLIYGFMALFV